MQRLEGASALSFLSENFLGHEVLTYTLDGQGGYRESPASHVLMNLVDRDDRARLKGGHVTMAISNATPFNMGFDVDEMAIYHIDSYIPEIIDADAVIEHMKSEAYEIEFQKYVEALAAWTTYDDEPESPDDGGDE